MGFKVLTTAGAIKQGATASADMAAATGTLTVTHGGTGRTSDTAYAVICGGTTPTDAHQSIASVGTSGQILTSNGAGALPTFQTAANAAGRLIGVQRITATGAYTYTATAGTTSVVIELQGAGGGGGGVASPAGSNVSLAAAGQAGGWLRVRLTSNFNGGTGSVGALGTGGAAGNNAGNAGGDTTFVSGVPTTYTAGGGAGGAGSASLGTTPIFRQAAISAGAVTNGDDGQVGWPGTFAVGAKSSNALGAYGGNSRYGSGGTQNSIGTNGTQAGGAASGKGAGGGAAAALGTGADAAGGNGSDGVVIIWEYS